MPTDLLSSDKYYSKYPYTLVFLRNNDEILLLNRQKLPWKGCWNGLGGKLEKGTDPNPVEGVLREILEESGIEDPKKVLSLSSCGVMEWYNMYKYVDGEYHSIKDESEARDVKGMYLFVADVSDVIRSLYLGDTPKKFDEGILDWKKLDWILDSDNLGVIKNVRETLRLIEEQKANEKTVFKAYFIDDHVVDKVIRIERD